MLIWLASYPRSGNTFLRILLHRLYAVPTSVVYDVDGVAARLGAELIGYQRHAGPLETLRKSDQWHFVKTHRQRDEDIDPADRAVCLVRDGRDALVSWARLECAKPGKTYRGELEQMITRDTERGTGNWGSNVLSWLRPAVPHRVVLRYEELVADPDAALQQVVTGLELPLTRLPDAEAPTFADLHRTDPGFFRHGRTGAHRDELPPDLHALFWSRPDNREAMAWLGYDAA